MLQGMELTRTNRSGGLTTYISRRRARARRPGRARKSSACANANTSHHACAGGSPGEGQSHHPSSPVPRRLVCLGLRNVDDQFTREQSPLTRATTGPPDTMPAGLRTSSIFFLVATPKRSHPFPSRTRKLSSSGPMVLQAQVCGRVGRCRGFEGSVARLGLLLFSAPESRARTTT